MIVVEGHTDKFGTPHYNDVLSTNRAKSVERELVQRGIGTEKIKIVGRGQEMPAMINGKEVSGSRQEQWPNRRVEIHLINT